MPNFLDILRALYGPLPRNICILGIFFKNLIFMNIAQNILAVTVIKFLYGCVYNYMPAMDDNFLFFFHFLASNMISTIAALMRLGLPGQCANIYDISIKFGAKQKW